MLSTDQIVNVKKELYSIPNINDVIGTGLEDDDLKYIGSSKRPDGFHLTFEAKKAPRYIGGDDIYLTEALLRAEAADTIKYILKDKCPCLKGLAESFCLVNVLKTVSNRYIVII